MATASTTSPSPSTSSDEEEGPPRRCFEEWMKLQAQDLSELMEALDVDHPNSDSHYSQLCQKSMTHFTNYLNKRSQLAPTRASLYFAPPWCSPWEISLLWLAGCRPSSFLRLVHALSASHLHSSLSDFLRGTTPTPNNNTLSPDQLRSLHRLQLTTIRQEESLTTMLASLQEGIADDPLAMIAKTSASVGEVNEEVGEVLKEQDRDMGALMKDADNLRLATLQELLRILTPFQAVHFLAASKKLHLCVHEWGKTTTRTSRPRPRTQHQHSTTTTN